MKTTKTVMYTGSDYWMIKMKYLLYFLSLFLFCQTAHAKSVILMIGDGMGYNHVTCTAKKHDLFLNKMPAAAVRTFSANDAITDSAASATAYSCGLKTNNYVLGLDKNFKPCETIAEKAIKNNKNVYILTTDTQNGATPSAFYVHTDSRYDNTTINSARTNFEKQSYLEFNIELLQNSVEKLLIKLDHEDKEYFVMIEGAKIDKASHRNDYDEMQRQLIDFDSAVEKVWNFAKNHDVNVYVTADHETGGLRADNCQYFTENHTPLDVPLWIYGDNWNSEETYDNTAIFRMMDKALFSADK